ncbi:MAG: DUF4982 domain-containing protein [Roseburia sp.]|nr:DUF4982 domain-containing protein [Roseburia sp.]MCM1099618.1 DUF4982 domain-containing protein [Ruminococcus flavefaciens]
MARLFCDGWEFSKNPYGTEYSDRLVWEKVDLPHDWLIYDVKNLYETSTGWYRRGLSWSPREGQRVSLRFEGVYMDSRVYVNGQQAGEWKYGYSTFEFDVTELLREGENLISVRVDYQSPNSRWYSGAGIYRRVWLKVRPACHLTADGVYIRADADGSVQVSVEVERPEGIAVAGFSVRHQIYDGERLLAETERDCSAADRSCIPEPVRREGWRYAVNESRLRVENPVLWDIRNPKRYRMVTSLLENGQTIDFREELFGFRSIAFTPDGGFFLNGRHVKLQGCCEHHDLGALGAAVNRAAIRRKLETLRRMGANAIRTSHNMPAVELMELADEMGFLILSEGFDMWEMPKTEYDYARFFPEWVARDVASWVRRDRNHPSVIGWSIGNEIYDTHAGERGQEIASMLCKLVREHDPKGNGYVTIGSNYMQGENARKCADLVKLAGYNYAERLYREHHEKYPDWTIYGSETASVLQSRGIYHFPLSQETLADDDEQCSALGNCTTGWGAKNTEYCILADRDAEFSAGQFIWTGFDYIGEPTPYTTKNSYFGQFDTAGFAKDSAYLFRAAWTDYRTEPFVHLFPYWDFTEGEEIDVRVTSNAPEVELFFQGKSVGRRKLDQAHGRELTLDTKLVYEEGELCAVAYDEAGREIARQVRRSFGDTAAFKLAPDKEIFHADGSDLVFLEIAAYDRDGEFVANANNRVFVEVSGAGRLIGLDNGDSTDYEQYKGTSRRLFSGKLLAVIAAGKEAGKVRVRVTSPGLPESALTLRAVSNESPTSQGSVFDRRASEQENCPERNFSGNEPEQENSRERGFAGEASEQKSCLEGISALQENKPCQLDCGNPEQDIPVRKIAFHSERRVFTKEKRELSFQTLVSPANAAYAEEIEYRITTVLGIDSNLAEIRSVEGGRVLVHCLGDGEFYLRALCKNGTDKYHILSQIRLRGEGIGAAAFDPYRLVLGGLFTVSDGRVGNAFGHGASFAGENSWFGFERVDFGPVGSDTITIPIFANCDHAVGLRIYDGIPGKGGELLGDYVYHKKAVWLTYLPETYRLPRVLKGLHTIVLESGDGYQVQGFFFEERRREYLEIPAVEHEKLYGDQYTVEEDAVTGIGNNVTLEFGIFDFGEKGPVALEITGRSALPRNSVHLIFDGEERKRVILEFEGAGEYMTRRFSLEGISGKGKVSFVFLPGSCFDFKSFRFVG